MNQFAGDLPGLDELALGGRQGLEQLAMTLYRDQPSHDTDHQRFAVPCPPLTPPRLGHQIGELIQLDAGVGHDDPCLACRRGAEEGGGPLGDGQHVTHRDHEEAAKQAAGEPGRELLHDGTDDRRLRLDRNDRTQNAHEVVTRVQDVNLFLPHKTRQPQRRSPRVPAIERQVDGVIPDGIAAETRERHR